jgi:signal transduction histidine kinase
VVASPLAPRVVTLDAKVRRGRAAPGVALVVRDSGPGIPPDVMKRMFNPFFTTRASGTGLGLAIVHRIVDAHGGRTMVSNIRGAGGIAGAQVELVMPMATAP